MTGTGQSRTVVKVRPHIYVSRVEFQQVNLELRRGDRRGEEQGRTWGRSSQY